MTHKNISRAEALTIFQNLQPPLGLQLMLSDISADNNPAHAGHRNPVLFTSSRRCYVPRLQTQLFGKTSREMQHLLLKTTGQQDLAPKSCKVKSVLENQNGNCHLLFIQKKKKRFCMRKYPVLHLRTSGCHSNVPSPKTETRSVTRV